MKRFAEQLDWLEQCATRQRMAELVEAWASCNTGSYNVAGLGAFAEMLKPVLRELGGEIRQIEVPAQKVISDRGQAESRPLGPALAVRSPVRGTGPRVFLAIHTDTVFGAEHAFQRVTRTGENVLQGPGVCDAKGGLAVMLFALLALERSPVAGALNWEVLLNPDEEIGSPGSGHLFREAAGRHDVGLVFEPALADGNLAGSRKGSGNFTLVVHGRAAHVGRDIQDGRNAIHALAGLVSKVAGMAQEIPGITVSSGWIGGGGPVNVVPDLALCRVNVRVDNAAQRRAVEGRLRELVAQASVDGIRAEMHGEFHSPPKPLEPAMLRVLEHFHDCAGELGWPELTWRPIGGACDGNRLAAAGLPTVDSLGPRGGKYHMDQEFVLLDSLSERARLSALFLMRLAAGEIKIERRPAMTETRVP